ncbi:MAG: sulfurtransferase [Armatimonadetes bacterium]|nr:sulfurtransferase [Armatimonadota bacterium]MDW8121288.1 sulfurtransferase [Armatimonadota bacterium]
MVRGLATTVAMTLLVSSHLISQPLLTQPTLVTTDWLAHHLDHPNLRIIDARPTLRDYLDGHIPKSVYLNTETLRVSLGGVPAQLLPADRLAEIFGAIGVGNHHTVVIYSGADDAFAHATYVAFVLNLLGHRSIGVLDGGLEKWRAEGRPVTTDFPKLMPTRFVPRISQKLRVDWLTLLQSVRRREAQTLDARSPKAFASGHIPTARNAFLRENLQGDKIVTWKSKEELIQRFQKLGIDLKKPIITYCTSGREASQLWFTLRYILGIDRVLVYDGSWIDWSARKLPKESASR